MTPRRAKNVVAVTPGGAITEEMILGYIALFTVPDKPVSASKLNREWIAEGLPHELIPQTRKRVNAFQVACRSVETRKRGNEESTNKRRTEIEVDPVHETLDKCVYQVTTLVRDKDQEVIDHPKAMRVIFDKNTEDIRWEPLDAAFPRDQREALGERIRDFYDANSKKVPAARIRDAVRKLMDHDDATNLRRKAGGVYFVPSQAKGDLDSLATVFTNLWGGDAEVHLIPCANDEAQRELVERHFDLNVSSEIDEIMATVTGALANEHRAMRQDAIGNLLNRRKELGVRRERYAAMLDSDIGEVEGKLDLLDQQLEALVLAKAGD